MESAASNFLDMLTCREQWTDLPRPERKIRRFFLGTPRPTNESADFNLLYGPRVCLSAFFSELSNPGGETGVLFESETVAWDCWECEK